MAVPLTGPRRALCSSSIQEHGLTVSALRQIPQIGDVVIVSRPSQLPAALEAQRLVPEQSCETLYAPSWSPTSPDDLRLSKLSLLSIYSTTVDAPHPNAVP